MKLIARTVVIIITKDAGNGTKKEIASDIPKYKNIHFRLFDRNCLSVIFISPNSTFRCQAVYNSVFG